VRPALAALEGAPYARPPPPPELAAASWEELLGEYARGRYDRQRFVVAKVNPAAGEWASAHAVACACLRAH
jgi:hypothetical protein